MVTMECYQDCRNTYEKNFDKKISFKNVENCEKILRLGSTTSKSKCFKIQYSRQIQWKNEENLRFC